MPRWLVRTLPVRACPCRSGGVGGCTGGRSRRRRLGRPGRGWRSCASRGIRVAGSRRTTPPPRCPKRSRLCPWIGGSRACGRPRRRPRRCIGFLCRRGKITPATSPPRVATAMLTAASPKATVGCRSDSAKPSRRRENRSSTVARNTGPWAVSVCMKSPAHFRSTPTALNHGATDQAQAGRVDQAGSGPGSGEACGPAGPGGPLRPPPSSSTPAGGAQIREHPRRLVDPGGVEAHLGGSGGGSGRCRASRPSRSRCSPSMPDGDPTPCVSWPPPQFPAG